MSLSLAVIGETGQLAKAIKSSAAKQGFKNVFYNRRDCDLSSSAAKIEAFICEIEKPDALIIAAAYTSVDVAENDHETAYAVNTRAPICIANACAQRNIPLVHISTDYVFNGKAKNPYPIHAPTSPVNVYGATKLEGEQGIIRSNCCASILRTSWVYDGKGNNFMTTMLRLALTHTDINVVDDQIGRPTFAGHLADAAIKVATSLVKKKSGCQGIFHVSGTGDPISWADFARAIFSLAQHELPRAMRVVNTPTPSRPSIATRPLYSVLDTRHFEQVFNTTLPHWKDGLKQAYEQTRR